MPDSSFVDTAKAVVDSIAAVPALIPVSPESPIGKLLYPALIALATLGIRFIRPLYELNKTWVLRISALALGILNVWIVQGHPMSASTILSGIALGAGAIGGWELVGNPILFANKTAKAQRAEKAIEEDK